MLTSERSYGGNQHEIKSCSRRKGHFGISWRAFIEVGIGFFGKKLGVLATYRMGLGNGLEGSFAQQTWMMRMSSQTLMLHLQPAIGVITISNLALSIGPSIKETSFD